MISEARTVTKAAVATVATQGHGSTRADDPVEHEPQQACTQDEHQPRMDHPVP